MRQLLAFLEDAGIDISAIGCISSDGDPQKPSQMCLRA